MPDGGPQSADDGVVEAGKLPAGNYTFSPKFVWGNKKIWGFRLHFPK
jgi:hypothetical protein